jgi:hypothetical protein
MISAMSKHILGIVAVTAFIVFCTLLPFLPGPYDGLAVALSEMAHVFGTLGLLLVPIGFLWIGADRSERLVQKRHMFLLLALIASTIVWAGLWFAAVLHSGFVLGFVIVALWICVLLKAWSNFRRTSSASSERVSALPFYLVAVPVAVASLQWAFVERAIESSRNRAIRNSARLLAAIEDHHARNGKYPTSLLAEWPDYEPRVIGIREYRYEPHGEGYNLVFEQFNYRFGTREFVVYNPRDEHVMTAHASDILELTPAQLGLERMRGHYASHYLSQPHWKIFWFD